MFFRIHAFQGPGFLGSRFFRVQVFQGPGFSGSRFFRVQDFQGQVFSWSGSRFFRVWVQVLEVAFIFFIFGHHVKNYGLIWFLSLIYVGTNWKMSPIFQIWFCLPIVVQVYEFHGKSEKLNRKKLWITTKK